MNFNNLGDCDQICRETPTAQFSNIELQTMSFFVEILQEQEQERL